MIAARPTLRQLDYLVALDRERHFGRAASACHVSQPALSAGVAELERGLGTALVDRAASPPALTAAGAEIVGRARAILAATDELVAAAGAGGEVLAGPLRLAVIPTVAPFLLPRILAALPAAWPRLRLSVREMLTGPACRALHGGELDCVLLALPVRCGDVDTAELARDPLLLATGGGGEAAGARRAPDPDRLLLLEGGHCLSDHALAACGLPPGDGQGAGSGGGGSGADARLVASTLQTLVRLVDAGLGQTLLPAMAVDAGLLADTDITVTPLPRAAERRVALAWRAGHPRGEEFRALADTMRAAIGPA